jgi:hypothetical protein
VSCVAPLTGHGEDVKWKTPVGVASVALLVLDYKISDTYVRYLRKQHAPDDDMHVEEDGVDAKAAGEEDTSKMQRPLLDPS